MQDILLSTGLYNKKNKVWNILPRPITNKFNSPNTICNKAFEIKLSNLYEDIKSINAFVYINPTQPVAGNSRICWLSCYPLLTNKIVE